MIENIPPYVYQLHITERSLLQGDILKVEGQFLKYFTEFYPAIDHPENEDKYVMVLTQSCDLVKNEKRRPKLSHINVCLVRSLKAVIKRLVAEEIKPVLIGDKNLLQKDALDRLKDRLSKLLNNTDQKAHFFLPKQAPFLEDMVAILPLSFSFRIDHYNTFLQSKVLELKPEFQAKTGHLISQLYGRIGTPDLADSNWGDREIWKFISNLLDELNLKPVQEENFIQYVKDNINDECSNMDELIQQCETLKVAKSFKPVKNELMQNLRTHLITLFEDKDKISILAQMDKKALSQEIGNILQASNF